MSSLVVISSVTCCSNLSLSSDSSSASETFFRLAAVREKYEVICCCVKKSSMANNHLPSSPRARLICMATSSPLHLFPVCSPRLNLRSRKFFCFSVNHDFLALDLSAQPMGRVSDALCIARVPQTGRFGCFLV